MPDAKNAGVHLCPVCGQSEFESDGSYDICDICGWEDDPVQIADPKFRGGANGESLKEARAAWKLKAEENK